jgi:hypothetical protein
MSGGFSFIGGKASLAYVLTAAHPPPYILFGEKN